MTSKSVSPITQLPALLHKDGLQASQDYLFCQVTHMHAHLMGVCVVRNDYGGFEMPCKARAKGREGNTL